MLFHRMSKDHWAVIYRFLDRKDLNNLLLTSKKINRLLKSQYLHLVKQNNSLYSHHLLHHKDQVKFLIASWNSINIPQNILLKKLFERVFKALPFFIYKQNKFDLKVMALIASHYSAECAEKVNLEILIKFEKADDFSKIKMLFERPIMLKFLYFYPNSVMHQVINFISGYMRLGMSHSEFKNSNILFIVKILVNCLNFLSLVSLKSMLDKPYTISKNLGINLKLLIVASAINILLDTWEDLANPRSLILTNLISLAKINPDYFENNNFDRIKKDVSYLFNKLKRA